MKKIKLLLNHIIKLQDNNPKVKKEADELLAVLVDNKKTVINNKINKLSLFEKYLTTFENINTDNVKDFVDYLINNDDFQEQVISFVEDYIENYKKILN